MDPRDIMCDSSYSRSVLRITSGVSLQKITVATTFLCQIDMNLIFSMSYVLLHPVTTTKTSGIWSLYRNYFILKVVSCFGGIRVSREFVVFDDSLWLFNPSIRSPHCLSVWSK